MPPVQRRTGRMFRAARGHGGTSRILPVTDGRAQMSKILGNAIYLADPPRCPRQGAAHVHSTRHYTPECLVHRLVQQFSSTLFLQRLGPPSLVTELALPGSEDRLRRVKERLTAALNRFLYPISELPGRDVVRPRLGVMS